MEGARGKGRGGIMMDTFQVLGEDEGDDGDSQKRIVKESTFQVTRGFK